MSWQQEYVFVLWGERFEEAIATIFTTELREAGLRVKVVSLSQQRTRGTHGLALVPDLTLEKALPLARRTLCLVIPCKAPGVKHLQSDPRFDDFIDQARMVKAMFIVGQDANDHGLLPAAIENIAIYPENERLIEFARDVAGRLR